MKTTFRPRIGEERRMIAVAKRLKITPGELFVQAFRRGLVLIEQELGIVQAPTRRRQHLPKRPAASPEAKPCSSTFRGRTCAALVEPAELHVWHFAETDEGPLEWHDDDVAIDGGAPIPPGLWKRVYVAIMTRRLELAEAIEVVSHVPEVLFAELCRVAEIAEDTAALEAWIAARGRPEVLALLREAEEQAEHRAIVLGSVEEDEEERAAPAAPKAAAPPPPPIAAPARPWSRR